MRDPDSKRKDLSGKTFGRLKVGAVALAEKGLVYWNVTCECGVSKTIKTAHLTSGRVKSCGCLSKEMTIERTATHRMSKTPIYRVWSAIQQRCTNPKNISYKYYGGRGIKICDRWLKFDNFFEDMGPSYKKGLSIERAEVNGDYEKSNCSWEVDEVQRSNRTDNVFIVFKGERMTVTKLSKVCGINYPCLSARLRKGWDVEKAATKPIKKNQTS